MNVNVCACIHPHCDQMFQVSNLMFLSYKLIPPLNLSSLHLFSLPLSQFFLCSDQHFIHWSIHSFIYPRLAHSTLVNSLTHPLIHLSVCMAFTGMCPTVALTTDLIDWLSLQSHTASHLSICKFKESLKQDSKNSKQLPHWQCITGHVQGNVE